MMLPPKRPSAFVEKVPSSLPWNFGQLNGVPAAVIARTVAPTAGWPLGKSTRPRSSRVVIAGGAAFASPWEAGAVGDDAAAFAGLVVEALVRFGDRCVTLTSLGRLPVRSRV